MLSIDITFLVFSVIIFVYALIVLEIVLISKTSKIFVWDLLMLFAIYSGWSIGNFLTETQFLRSFSPHFIKSLSNLIEPILILPILIALLYAIRIILIKNKSDIDIQKISRFNFVISILVGFIEALAMPGLSE